MLSPEQGKELLNLARLAISASLGRISDIRISMSNREFLEENKGAFVTLNKGSNLRGCVGFTDAELPLGVGVLRAAKGAAFEDTRFKPVTLEELEKIKIEVTVLTPMKAIKIQSQRDLDKITIGKDGLRVKYKSAEGLLLPQVAEEYGWTPEMFLEQTCLKAGLSKNAWLEGASVYKFQGQVFSE